MKKKFFLVLISIPSFILNAQVTTRTHTTDKSQFDGKSKNLKLEKEGTDTTSRAKYIEVVSDNLALPKSVLKQNIHSHPHLTAQ